MSMWIQDLDHMTTAELEGLCYELELKVVKNSHVGQNWTQTNAKFRWRSMLCGQE